MELEAYNREQIKAQLQELQQKIASQEAIGAGEEELKALHEEYERLQAQLDHSELDEAA